MYNMFTCAVLLYVIFAISSSNSQYGPDPWDVGRQYNIINNDDFPPDLKIVPKKVNINTQGDQIRGEWFYKRLVAIILKGGQRKENEDETIDVSLQMKYSQEQWHILDELMKSNTVLTDEMLRKSIGYIEGSIYKPTLTEKIALAWSEYIYSYLVEYKEYITWSISILTAITGTFWLWQYLSYKHLLLLLFITFYLYEAFLSYKEAEKEQVSRFLSAIRTCKWYFWTSNCEVDPPDPLIMLKHMNPLKIGIRLFTTIVSEPMIAISNVASTMILNITDGLWYPLNNIIYGILIIIINFVIIILLVGIIFNYLLNIPFSIGLPGFFTIALKQGNRNITPANTAQHVSINATSDDKITGETLNKVLDVCSRALSITQSNHIANVALACSPPPNRLTSTAIIKRSSSTGRLPDLMSNSNCASSKQNGFRIYGGGDAR